MNGLILPATRNTPSIFFEPASGRFEVSGVSVPENASEYYQPVFEWLAINLAHVPEGAIFEFRLSYFNSTSLKAIYQMLKQIKETTVTGPRIGVRWYVEDGDEFMLESAEMFEQLLDMPFEKVHVADNTDSGPRQAV